MGDQLLMGPDRYFLTPAQGQNGPPAGADDQIPATKETGALDPSQGIGLAIQLAQQATSPFHVCRTGQERAGNHLSSQGALLRAAYAVEAPRTVCPPQLLQPDPTDHSPHRKTQKIYPGVSTEALLNVLIQARGQLPQGNPTQTMGQMRRQQRAIAA